MSIPDGWMDGVEHIPTAAYGGYAAVPNGTMWPKQIVNHIMQGYQNTMIGWAQQRPPVQRASAHFTINRAGRIVQHVSLWDPAWHVAWTDWNLHSIGIEHEGFSVNPGYAFDYVYDTAHPWPQAMVDASIRVNKWVMEAIRAYDASVVPDLSTIIGHKDTGQPDRVNDPGTQWYAQVRPLVLAAFAPPAPPPEPTITMTVKEFEAIKATVFRAGRKEMYFGLKDKIASLESEWNV